MYKKVISTSYGFFLCLLIKYHGIDFLKKLELSLLYERIRFMEVFLALIELDMINMQFLGGIDKFCCHLHNITTLIMRIARFILSVVTVVVLLLILS